MRRSGNSDPLRLRYALQGKSGLRWYTVRTWLPDHANYEPFPRAGGGLAGDYGFKLAAKVGELAARDHKRPFRVLLMPYNIQAVYFDGGES